jgi:hypothetical protein
MARSRSKNKSRSDGAGGYGGLPKFLWKHPDYCNLSGNAAKLLMDFACQFNGRNNGDLTNAYSVLKGRGWRSKQTIQRATNDLLESGLIIQTREGRFVNPGGVCALYAITWKAVDECPGKNLTVAPTNTPPRKFTLEHIKTPGPQNGQGSVHKRGRQRARDKDGKFVSVHKRGRLKAVT